MLKRGKNRGLQVIVSLAISSAIFLGGQGVAMADEDDTDNSVGLTSMISALGVSASGACKMQR